MAPLEGWGDDHLPVYQMPVDILYPSLSIKKSFRTSIEDGTSFFLAPPTAVESPEAIHMFPTPRRHVETVTRTNPSVTGSALNKVWDKGL